MKNNYFKWLLLSIVLSIASINTMWAGPSFKGGYVYFYNKGGWTDSNKQLCIGKDSYTSTYSMTAISNTKLWYNSLISSGWEDATYMAVIGNSSSWGSGSWGPSNLSNANHRTGTASLGNWGFNSGNVNMLTPASGSNDAALTLSYVGDAYSSLNLSQTFKVQVSTNGGSTYSDPATSPLTVTFSSKTFSNYTTCGTNSSGSISGTTVSTSKNAGYTATTTLIYSSLNSDYDFVCWHDGTSNVGTGTSYTYYPTAATTITARVKLKQFTVSYGVCSSTRNGSIKLNSGSAVTTTGSSTLNKGTAIAFTATPNSGYQVEGWYSDAACSAGNRLQSGGTSYDAGTLTAAKTVYVKFEARTGGVITLSAGTGGQVSKDNSSWAASATYTSITTTAALNIYARANTGYSFSSWSKTSGSGTIASTSSASTTFTPVAYEDATVTASFNEIMSSLSTFNHYDVGNPGYAAPTKSASSIGISTTATLTATTPSAGYTFAGWTLSSNLVVTSGNKDTDLSITVRTNGNGAAATAQANYTEDLTSTWYVEGDASGPFLGWTANATTMLQKKTGYSTSNDVYWTATVTAGQASPAATQWEFKIYNSAGATEDAKWYGWGTDANYYWLTNENNSLTLSNGTNNVRFKPYLAGEYEFHFNTSTKVLTVTWPVINQVRISAASPTDATNTGNFDLSAPVSNVRSLTRSLNANTTYTFKIVYTSEWYGYNSGTFTRNSSTSSNSRTINTSGGDMTLTTDYAGNYTFKFNQSSKALSVDFPEAYKVTFGKGSVDGSEGSCSAVDIDNGSSAVTSNSTWVKSGNRVKLTAPEAKTGYSWKGWYGNNAGTGDAISINQVCTLTVNSAKTAYACYTENTFNVTATASAGGSATPTSATSMGQVTGGDITASPNTGYNFVNWTITSGSGYFGTSGTATTSTTANTKFRPSSAATIRATFTPKTTTITLDNQGATTAGSTSVTATYGAAMPTITLPTKTGYTFGGYFGAPGGSGPQYYDADGSSAQNWNNTDATYTLLAYWIPNNYTVELDLDEDHKGNITGATTSQSVTYNAVTTTVPLLPTAEQGYGLDGYYTGHNGEGSKLINSDGTWIASVDGYTDADKKWIHAGGETLYAYYKKAEIASITVSPAIVEPNATVSATPALNPNPNGTTRICWEVQYSNGTPLPSQPTFTPGAGNSVSFTAPASSATYLIEAKLYTGDDCGSGTLLSTNSTTFQVAGSHEVTLLFKSGDMTIKASEVLTEIKPLEWSDDITAPTITGYTFARWDAGDGVTIKNGDSDPVTTSTNPTIQIKAVYDGTLTAVYTQKRMIYFYNTLNWENVYVYFYKNDSYWQTVSPYNGTGANKNFTYTNTPYSEELHGQMLPVSEGSSIYYFDAEAEGVNASYTTVAFTEHDQNEYDYFWRTNAVRRSDYKSTTMPMFVPLGDQTAEVHNETNYLSSGYWMNYPENTGYTLKIYAGKDDTEPMRTIRFPYSADLKMPLKLDVEFNDANWHDYYFTIYREDGQVLSADYGMNQNYHSDVRLNNPNKKIKITTTASGIYTYTLVYKDDSGTDYFITVDYPIATNDYRVRYTDNATWSNSAHVLNTWYHPSDVIRKNTDAEVTQYDTVSFFISKNNSPAMKFQYASAIAESGTITWSDVAGGSITIPSDVVTADGTYNFIIKQVGTANPVLEKVEPYTGNYYIRTDCAGSTKWDSYKAVDHQMTFSEYTKANEGYSHYFAHWVDRGSNIKFVIANDYSPCVSDTLTKDVDIDFNNMDDGGTLKNDGSAQSYQDKYSANIRFMYNEATNKLSRAYLASSTDVSKKFLVMRGNSAASTGHIFTEDGKELTDAAGGRIAGLDEYEMKFQDDENFIYETVIKANPTALIKLYAKYCDRSQEFKGDTSAAFVKDVSAIEILGGTYAADTKEKMRIVYDFKTNRLVCAWLPSGDITGELDINADVMIIREHQGDAQQIRFTTNESKLEEVKTVYGVMRFNRWTLNNKDKSTHNPVGDPKSQYERSLYWVSFPFDVNLSDVFGFGTYGVDWIIEYYDGAARAAEGYWIDSPGFWKFVMPSQRASYKLEAGKGYVLALDLDRMKDNNTDFWANNIEQIELFFPSASTAVGEITATDVKIEVPEHECTIDRTDPKGGADINKNRTKADSHWNMIGVPSYANYGTTLSDGSSVVTWNSTPYTQDLPFLYEWNMVDDSYTVQSGTTYPFKSMHAYMVQYAGDLIWSLASATPSSIVARRTYASAPQEVEFCLELQYNEQMADQTFVKLSEKEEVSANFNFDEDLFKELNSGKANIYTIAENYIPVAGNTLPMSDQTVLIPVGVRTTADGDYTFSMPAGTSGVGVTLVDGVTGERTNLSLTDYTVSLEQGTYDQRFVLEISAVDHTTTGVESINGENSDALNGVCKKLIDGVLYIIKDGKVFDARGARLQ